MRILVIWLLLLMPAQAMINSSGPSAQIPTMTIGTLPSCNGGNRGRLFVVTDALTPVVLTAAIGGGAVTVKVFCNGSSWIVG